MWNTLNGGRNPRSPRSLHSISLLFYPDGRERGICSSPQTFLQWFHIGSLKADSSESVYTMEIGTHYSQISSPHTPNKSQPTCDSIYSCLCLVFSSLAAAVPWDNPTDTSVAHWPGPGWCTALSYPSSSPNLCCSTVWLFHSHPWQRLHSLVLSGLWE